MAGVVQADKSIPYLFPPEVERTLAAFIARSPNFYGRVGKRVDPEALHDESAKLVVRASHTIFAERGHGPDSWMIVIFRLSAWVREGKLSREKVEAVSEYLDAAEAAGLPPEGSFIEELIPTIRERINQDMINTALKTKDRRSPEAMDDVRRLMEMAANLGKSDASVGTRFDAQAFEEFDRAAAIPRLPTGITELDIFLNGGLPRGGLGVTIGGAGDGKSMMLNHITGCAVSSGRTVLYATLELPTKTCMDRLLSNMTGVPIDDLEFPAARQAAFAQVDAMPGCGSSFVKDFTAHASTVQDLNDWVKQTEDLDGEKIDLLVVDYADLLSVPGPEKSQHEAMRVVYEGLRLFAVEHQCWVWTASQSRGREEREQHGKKRKKVLDLQHVSESVYKVRVADLVITLNLDGGDMGFYVAKNRNGKAREMVGPTQADFARGQLAPIVRTVSTRVTRAATGLTVVAAS